MPALSRPLRVAVLCSRRAPALRYLLQHDRNRGVLYDVVACLTSDDTFEDEEIVGAADVPLLRHSIWEFCRRNAWRVSERSARIAYDAITRRRLASYDVDLIVLDAYLYRLSHPVLWAYPGRIINVHHSDLLERDAAGNCRFVGLRAVRDAILAGAPATRATVHLVTDQLDQGPPLLRSWPFPVAPLVQSALAWGAADILKAYAYAHQEWLIRATWGPLVATTIRLIAEGRLDLRRRYQTAGPLFPPPFELDEDGRVRDGAAPRVASTSRLLTAG
jgi:folate-dependent phosphoribosylglycinamide formyltransferase PurN